MTREAFADVMVLIFACALVAAAAVSAILIRVLRPLLVRYALARPNARSSHTVPTPQGGGIAVVAGTLLAGSAAVGALDGVSALPGLTVLIGATLALALLGAVDDIRPLPAGLRLLVQLASVGLVVWALDPGRMLPGAVPIALERVVLVVAGTWWVNLVNFMDGIDWITVAEFVPLTGVVAGLALLGIVPPSTGALAASLLGALLAFAPANRPVARLFLGDVGSLPIGLVTGAMLLVLADRGHLAAALLLPLYHLVDATLTLALRTHRRERVWEAHRSHFYQRALGHGFRVMDVDRRVFVLNLVLAGLAAATLAWPSLSAPMLVLGTALVGLVLRSFARPRSA